MRGSMAALLACLLGAGFLASCAPAGAERAHGEARPVALDADQARAALAEDLRGPLFSFPASPEAFGDYDGPMIYPARAAGVRFSHRFEESAAFYAGTLGLPELFAAETARATRIATRDRASRSFGAAMGQFTLHPSEVPVDGRRAIEAIGWGVRDIDRVAAALAVQGVQPTRFAGATQRDDGVWIAPNGDKVLWFTDPDGYPLAVVQQKPFAALQG